MVGKKLVRGLVLVHCRACVLFLVMCSFFQQKKCVWCVCVVCVVCCVYGVCGVLCVCV